MFHLNPEKVVKSNCWPTLGLVAGRTLADILLQCADLKDYQFDGIEWRVDFFEEGTKRQTVCEVLPQIKEAIGHIPLLFTFRTYAEGGADNLDEPGYFKMINAVLDTGCVAAIDIEYFHATDAIHRMQEKAKSLGIEVLLSNQSESQEIKADILLKRVVQMQALKPDAIRMAYTLADNKDDVILQEVQFEGHKLCPEIPLLVSEL